MAGQKKDFDPNESSYDHSKHHTEQQQKQLDYNFLQTRQVTRIE